MRKLCSLLLTVMILMLCISPNVGMAEEAVPFRGMNDPALLPYLEGSMYEGLVSALDSEGYFVENVQAVYISQEYLDELAYNSQANVYFGYTLEELDAQFQGEKYIFTLGANNETVVEPWTAYDDIYERVIRNVAIGTGVILVCVTVSVVSAGVGAPAVSMIFAMAAKGGAIGALSGAATGGIPAFIATGIQTGDMEAAARSAMVAGSEGFKWGAICGTVSGGIKGVNEVNSLKGATINGLALKEASKIQHESGYPIDVIKQFKTMDEFNIYYHDAKLRPLMLNNKLALVNKDAIDLTYISEMKINGQAVKVTNLRRMQLGYAPVETITNKPFTLHHIGQKADATLAVLSEADHQGNAAILNIIGKSSEVDHIAFAPTRQAFWKSMASIYKGGR